MVLPSDPANRRVKSTGTRNPASVSLYRPESVWRMAHSDRLSLTHAVVPPVNEFTGGQQHQLLATRSFCGTAAARLQATTAQ